MSKYEPIADFLDLQSVLKVGVQKQLFREAAALLRQQGQESEAIEFAKYLNQNFRSAWMSEIRETGWEQIRSPYKTYSTEGAYNLFKSPPPTI